MGTDRRAYYVEQKSIREIARETGHVRRTISRMLDLEAPPIYQCRQPKQAHELGPYKKSIQELLAQNQTLPRKQRWTAPMIFTKIKKEGFQGAKSIVRHYVGQVHKLLRQPPVYLPLEFDPLLWCGLPFSAVVRRGRRPQPARQSSGY